MVPFGPGCKFVRGEPIEARVRSVQIVVDPPFLDDLSSMAVQSKCFSRHIYATGDLHGLSAGLTCLTRNPSDWLRVTNEEYPFHSVWRLPRGI